jgi:hypothetical protein
VSGSVRKYRAYSCRLINDISIVMMKHWLKVLQDLGGVYMKGNLFKLQWYLLIHFNFILYANKLACLVTVVLLSTA